MSTQPYYLRNTDRAAMVAALAQAGVAQDGEAGLQEIFGGCCVGVVDVGILYEGTGVFADDGQGGQIEQQAPIADANAAPYWHINLLADLTPEQITALSDYLLLDDNGMPRKPTHPHNVFAGWE